LDGADRYNRKYGFHRYNRAHGLDRLDRGGCNWGDWSNGINRSDGINRVDRCYRINGRNRARQYGLYRIYRGSGFNR